jgi:hypothetical protein
MRIIEKLFPGAGSRLLQFFKQIITETENRTTTTGGFVFATNEQMTVYRFHATAYSWLLVALM